MTESRLPREREPLIPVETAHIRGRGESPCQSSATTSNRSPSPSRTTVSCRITRCRCCSTSRRSTSTTSIPRKPSRGCSAPMAGARCGGRRHSSRRHRASVPFREQGFFRGRRLSAGSQNAGHAADARESSQGAGNDSEGQAAEQRSGDGRERTAGEIVEVDRKSCRHCERSEAIQKRKPGKLRRCAPRNDGRWPTLRCCLPDGWLRTGTRCGARFHR